MCLVAINIVLRWQNTSILLSIDMQFVLDEEKLPFLTIFDAGRFPKSEKWEIQKCHPENRAVKIG